jgi:hypothetical protein
MTNLVENIKMASAMLSVVLSVVMPSSLAMASQDETTFTESSARIAVFDKDYIARAAAVQTGLLLSPYWKPTLSQLSSIDRALLKRFTDQPRAYDFQDYRMQVLGFTNEKKEPKVFVNGFCKYYWQIFTDWRSTLVDVNEGGECFFSMTYDPRRMEIDWLQFHNRL